MSTTPVPAALRRRVQERAFGCCEYCLLAEEDAWFSHEVDHIIAKKHAGETIIENLAWACFDCNRFKGSDISSLDPISKQLTPLFNPRTELWLENFQTSLGVIRAITPVGAVTEKLLKLNLPARVEIRSELAISGRYPPKLN